MQVKTMILRLVAAFLFLAVPQSAWAEVVVTFYSHELGNSFPHAFFTVKGKIDATGQPVDDNFGFTAKNVTPAILWGSVAGRMDKVDAKYLKSSQQRFSVTVDDANYAKLIAFVRQWEAVPAAKSYNLGNRNCVHFVMEAAASLGLKVNRQSKYFKKPRSFLEEVKQLNLQIVVS